MICEYASLRRGLVAAWCPSISRSGYVLPDAGAANANASITAATWSALPGGVALSFNGTSAVAQAAYPERLLNGIGVASQSMWMHRTATTVTVCCGFSRTATGTQSGARFSAYWAADGSIYINAENNSTFNGAFPLTGTGWKHVAFVFDGTKATDAERLVLYVNGAPVAASAFSGNSKTTLAASLGTYTLGKDSSDRFGAGSLDDVRVYSRALTRQEAATLSSRRGIGLTSRRHRRGALPAAPVAMSVRVGGSWVSATPYVKVSGTWQTATPYTRVSGLWR